MKRDEALKGVQLTLRLCLGKLPRALLLSWRIDGSTFCVMNRQAISRGDTFDALPAPTSFWGRRAVAASA